MKYLLAVAIFAFFAESCFGYFLYEYSGNNFNEFAQDDLTPGNYDSSHRVTGFFTLRQPLVPRSTPGTLFYLGSDDNIFQGAFPAVTFQFSDGRQTISWKQIGSFTQPSIIAIDWVSDDGLPYEWFIALSTINDNGLRRLISTTSIGGTDGGSQKQCLTNITCDILTPGDDGYVLNRGTWTVRQIPEPTTLALMGLGIAGLGFRRKIK